MTTRTKLIQAAKLSEEAGPPQATARLKAGAGTFGTVLGIINT